MRGAKEPGKKAPHIVSAVTHGAGILLAQATVPEKKNENGVLHKLLDPLNLSGAMVTIDAMHTNNNTATYLTDQKLTDYMLTVKDNQPTLRADLEALFREASLSPHYTAPTTKVHGRIETRSITLIELECGDLYLHKATLALKITRSRTFVKSGKESYEVVYCLTSADPRKYTPQQLLEFNRGHWRIEANHHIRDVTFQEDASRKRLGASFMAALRGFAIGFLQSLGVTSIAAATRELRYSLMQA